MESLIMASVIAEGDTVHCISACATAKSGEPSIAVSGVTDAADQKIRDLILAVAKRHRIRLPKRAIAVDLVFDVPFESVSELAFATILAITETFCPSDVLHP